MTTFLLTLLILSVIIGIVFLVKHYVSAYVASESVKRLCINCRHCLSPGEFAQCNSPRNNMERDPIDGKPRRRWHYCSVHRNGDWVDSCLINTCGKLGKWFEPIEEEKTPVDTLLESIRKERS